MHNYNYTNEIILNLLIIISDLVQFNCQHTLILIKKFCRLFAGTKRLRLLLGGPQLPKLLYSAL